MAGLVPAIPIPAARRCSGHRDCRDKPGNDARRSNVSRAQRSMKRSGMMCCRPGIVTSSAPAAADGNASPPSWPGSSRPSRFPWQCSARVIEIAGTSPAMTENNRPCNRYGRLDIRHCYSYIAAQCSLNTDATLEGTPGRRGECGARGWGHPPRSRAAWASCLPALRPGRGVLPGLGQAMAGNARWHCRQRMIGCRASDRVPGNPGLKPSLRDDNSLW